MFECMLVKPDEIAKRILRAPFKCGGSPPRQNLARIQMTPND